MSNATITVLPGDGVGPEVTAQARAVLGTVEEKYGHTFTVHERRVGLDAIEAEGTAISDDTFETCAHSDALLFGAVGSLPAGQTRSGGPRPEQALFRLRKEFGFFANLRPVRPFESLYAASSLKPEHLKGTDMLFVRELSVSLYYGRLESVPGKPSEIRRTARGTEAVDTLLYTEEEIERVVRAAFGIAMRPRAEGHLGRQGECAQFLGPVAGGRRAGGGRPSHGDLRAHAGRHLRHAADQDARGL